MRPMSRSAMRIPSPCVSGGTAGAPARDPTAVTQRLAQLVVGRNFSDLLLGEPTGRVYHEAPAFERMMTDRHLDLFGENRPDHRSRKLRHMDFLMLRHEGVAGERIVVFPARQRPDAPGGRVDHF